MKNLLLKYIFSFLGSFLLVMLAFFSSAGEVEGRSFDLNSFFLNPTPLFAQQFSEEPEEPECESVCTTCDCIPPSCPSGTTSTYPGGGIVCLEGTYTNSCTGSCECITGSGCCPPSPINSCSTNCYHPENDPAPSSPDSIRITSPRSCTLSSSTERIYYSGSVSYRGQNATNNRAGDSLGRSPFPLDYPTQSINVSEGSTYTANPRAESTNRCAGKTVGPSVQGNFTVNNVPEVISIKPLEPHYNLGVSGRSDSKGPDKDFGCETDNPKGFEVVFRDKDGCGDISDKFSADTNICGATSPRNLSLRGVEEDTSSVEVVGEANEPISVSCKDNQYITAHFKVEFEGPYVGNLNMQAKADDIVGNTSGWVQPSGDKGGSPYWSYAGRPPTYQIESLYDNILDVRKFQVIWEVKDWTSGMSGVQAVRIFSTLDKGNILTDDSDYGPIIYEDDEFDVLGDEKEVWFEEVSKVEARENDYWEDIHLVDVGINQDGDLSFRIEAVDGACNYSDKLEKLELGTPWIATRGGLVHSTGGFSLNVRSVVYNNPDIETHKNLYIKLGELGDLVHNEETSISTELLTYGPTETTNFGWTKLFYRLAGYTKSSNINTGWHDRLLARAQIRDPGGRGIRWDIKTGDEVTLSQGELNDNCGDSQYVYFIENDLIVNEKNKAWYENIGRDGVNGCIFVVRGNLTIDEGVYKSGGE